MLTIKKTFLGDEGRVRTLQHESATLFVVSDLAEPLGLGKSRLRQKYNSLDEDEKGGVKKINTLGGEQKVQLVNRRGLNTMILSCPKAHQKGTRAWRYRRWVLDVLESIFETGKYEVAALQRRLTTMTSERDAALAGQKKRDIGAFRKIADVLGFYGHCDPDRKRVVEDVKARLRAAGLVQLCGDRYIFVNDEALEEALPLIRRHQSEADRCQSRLTNYFRRR